MSRSVLINIFSLALVPFLLLLPLRPRLSFRKVFRCIVFLPLLLMIPISFSWELCVMKLWKLCRPLWLGDAVGCWRGTISSDWLAFCLKFIDCLWEFSTDRQWSSAVRHLSAPSLLESKISLGSAREILKFFSAEWWRAVSAVLLTWILWSKKLIYFVFGRW